MLVCLFFVPISRSLSDKRRKFMWEPPCLAMPALKCSQLFGNLVERNTQCKYVRVVRTTSLLLFGGKPLVWWKTSIRPALSFITALRHQEVPMNKHTEAVLSLLAAFLGVGKGRHMYSAPTQLRHLWCRRLLYCVKGALTSRATSNNRLRFRRASSIHTPGVSFLPAFSQPPSWWSSFQFDVGTMTSCI